MPPSTTEKQKSDPRINDTAGRAIVTAVKTGPEPGINLVPNHPQTKPQIAQLIPPKRAK
jgi:hypothetical protein